MKPDQSHEEDALIRRIHGVQIGDLTQETQERLCHSLLASYDSMRTRQTAAQPQKRVFLGFHFLIPAFIIVLMLVAGTGTVIAADSAKPGDMLFGVDCAVEHLHLAMARTPAQHASVLADIADEREQEMQELQRNGDAETLLGAHAQVDSALENAQERLDEVQEKLIENGASDNAVAALGDVQERLTTIKERHLASIDTELQQLKNAKVRLSSTGATVTFQMKGKPVTFRMETTDRAAILKEIAHRTGLPESSLTDAVRFTTKKDAQPTENDETHPNADAGDNPSANTSPSVTEQSDGRAHEPTNSDEQTGWSIAVQIRGNSSSITARNGETEEQWELNTSNQTALLANIAARTKLTTAEVASLWVVEISD